MKAERSKKTIMDGDDERDDDYEDEEVNQPQLLNTDDSEADD